MIIIDHYKNWDIIRLLMVLHKINGTTALHKISYTPTRKETNKETKIIRYHFSNYYFTSEV